MSHPPSTHASRPTADRLSWRQSLVVTVAGAVVAGLAEATNAVYRHRVSHLPTGEFVAGELFWMAPLAAAVFLGGLWILWQGLVGLAPARWGLRAWGTPLVAAVATFSLVTAMALGVAFYAKLVQRIRSALVHLLPAGLSAIVTARRNERHLRREIKRLEELSSHLLSDIGYRRTLLGDYVLDKTISGKPSVADTSPVSRHSCPDDAQLAARKAA